MEIFKTSYQVWKNVVDANDFAVYLQDSPQQVRGAAWAGTQNFIYELALNESNRSTFDTDFPASGLTIVDTKDDAIAQIVGLNDVPNHFVTSPTHAHIEENAKFKGFIITAEGVATDTIHDHLITNEIYIHGGWFWSDGGVKDDYAELSVVDKDDVLGLFDSYGLTVGEDVLELAKYVETQYLKPGGMEMTHLETPTIANVASGLYMRTKIHTTSLTEVNVGVTYLWFEV